MQMDKIEETKRVVLANHREIILEDEDDILLSYIEDGQTRSVLEIPYPDAGYGGGGLFLSPSEQYMAFVSFSGESEEAFVLFKIEDDSLEVQYESGYLYGEEGDYAFSADERLFFQTLRTGTWYAGEEEVDADGNKFYEFGAINVLNLQEKTFVQHTVDVCPSDDWEEEITDSGAFQILGLIENKSLEVALPWGKEILAYPLASRILLRSK